MVGAVGSLIVWVLAIVIMVKSCSNGLPQLGRWAGSSAGPGETGQQPLQMHACMPVVGGWVTNSSHAQLDYSI